MRIWLSIIIFSLAVLSSLQVANSVEPDEILKNPELEARARKLSLELRCLVCQNQSIDDSNAPLAKDLRVLVRDRLKEGDTDKQVIDYIVSRYGEFVLLRPLFNTHTLILWLSPLLFFFAGLILMWKVFSANKPSQKKSTKALSSEEEEKLRKLVEEEG